MKIELEAVLTTLILTLVVVGYVVYDYGFDTLIDYLLR